MIAAQSVLNVINEKGWNLYRALPQSDLPSIVSKGPVSSIEINLAYVMLPVASRDENVHEVGQHMINAAETKQLPTYNDTSHGRMQIEYLLITDNGLNIKTADSNDVHFFNFREMVNAVKRCFSNYNVYFFPSIDELSCYFRKHDIDVSPPEEPDKLRWTYVGTESPDSAIIYPLSRPSLLFRGQHRRYRPCYPSVIRNIETRSGVLRDLSPAEQSTLILNLIRTAWFNDNLQKTAAIRWMFTQGLSVDENAIAQHYGLPTGYIDLSQSFDVASFFACCEYNAACSTWKPRNEGYGVIYAVDMSRTPVTGPTKPIALQPFPRPSEQWGWVHEVLMGEDFDALPHVRKFIFKHDSCASTRILERFDSGAKLFPPDPLSDVADTIIQSREIPKEIGRSVVEDLIEDGFGLPGERWQDVLTMVSGHKGVEFLSSSVQLIMRSRMISDMDAIWERRKDAFFRGIGVRLVRSTC